MVLKCAITTSLFGIAVENSIERKDATNGLPFLSIFIQSNGLNLLFNFSENSNHAKK